MSSEHQQYGYPATTLSGDRASITVRPVAATLAPPEEELIDVNMVIPERDLTLTRVVNGLLLAACFGYALYTIINIDHGMTRGWTAAEIAKRVPLDNWNSYETALNEKPVTTKTAINVIIYLLGDWLSQTAFQKKNVLDFDLSRTLRNGFIGLCFGPLVHQYYEFSDHILPVEGGLLNRAEKILMDQTIYLSVKCSIYISAVSLLGGESWETTQQTVKDRIGPVVITAWKFWPLVHCITYGLIPARHRILWVNCVDLVWNAILASKAREPEEPGGDESMQEEEEHHKIWEAEADMLASAVEEDASDAALVESQILSFHTLDALESSALKHMNMSQEYATNSTMEGELSPAST
jgi:protein Mpv17